MNAMSVSPVKPPINTGNHAVPATATNLTKQPIPTANNFTPLNLIPEAKPASVPVSTSPEKSVDLISKPHTSNGTVYSIAETNSNVCSINPSNCVENCETAENLSTNNSQKFSDSSSAPVETKMVNDVDEKKTEPKKVNIQPNESTEPETEMPAQIESLKEIQNVVVNISKEEVKEVAAVVSVDNTVKSEVSPAKKETVTEAAKMDPPKKEISEKAEKTESKTETSSRAATSKTTKRKAKPPAEPVEEESTDGRKSKRVRLPTQPYQSPIPELQLIAKLNAPTKSTPKNSTERIIAFYKNEFLAVRNPEGSFYICQTFQNIHKSSTKIKIRWFTHLPQDVFTPDFYDTTEFDCILTNVTMTRMEKDRWKLSDQERTRIENILKRALDVEKGVADQLSVTEEHPDGLDLSLFKDEAQLKKKKKSSSPKTKKTKASDTKKSKLADVSKSEKSPSSTSSLSASKKSPRVLHSSQSAKVSSEKTKATENKARKDKKNKRKTGKKNASAPKHAEKANSKVWEPSVKASNSSRVVLSLKKEDSPKSSESKPPKRTSNVSLKASSTAMPSLPPQKRKKEDAKSSAAINQTGAERAGKVRNAGSAVTAKINAAAMRTTKEKERKTSATSNQRKK